MHEGAITLMITTNENTTMNEKNNEFRSKKIKKAVTTLSQCQLNFTRYALCGYGLLSVVFKRKQEKIKSIFHPCIFGI